MNSTTRTTRWRLLIAVPLLVLLAPGLMAAKCQTDSGPGGVTKACDLREAQPPTFVAGPGRGLVQAKVNAACDAPPRQHVLTVWLEREGSDGKSWFQNGQSAVWQHVADFPPPGAGRDYPVSTGCIEGYWRVRARAEGIGPDGKAFSFSLPLGDVQIAYIKRCALK